MHKFARLQILLSKPRSTKERHGARPQGLCQQSQMAPSRLMLVLKRQLTRLGHQLTRQLSHQLLQQRWRSSRERSLCPPVQQPLGTQLDLVVLLPLAELASLAAFLPPSRSWQSHWKGCRPATSRWPGAEMLQSWPCLPLCGSAKRPFLRAAASSGCWRRRHRPPRCGWQRDRACLGRWRCWQLESRR